MKAVLLFLLLSSAAVLAQENLTDGPGGQIERIDIKGGPTVLLQCVPQIPAVSVCLGVAAGSNYEPTGKSGLASLLAHVAYRSTLHHPQARLLSLWEEMGARSGALTTPDQILFWETVPSAQAPIALEVEHDRLAGLMSDAKDLERERDLLLGELSTRLASPRERLDLTLTEKLWPAQKATRPEELRALTLDDLNSFAAQHLVRPGAIVTVVGGFSPPEMRTKVHKLFDEGLVAAPPHSSDPGKPGPVGEPLTQDGPATTEWLFPLGTGAPDSVTMALLDAALTSYGPQFQTRLDLARHTYRIRMLPGPGETNETAEAQLNEALLALRTQPLAPPQLLAAQARALAHFYAPLDDIAVRAVELAVDENASGLERTSRFAERLRMVTAEQLRTAAEFLSAAHAARGRLVPKAGGASAAGGSGAAASAVAMPPFRRHELENGLTVLIQPVHDLPIVTVRGYLAGGSMLDSVERPGLTFLAGELLGRGTVSRPGDKLRQELSEAGMELRFEPGRQAIEIRGRTPADKLKQFTALLADALRNPSPAPAAVEQVRAEALERLARRDADPEQKALSEFLRRIYPQDHPYGRPPLGTSEITKLIAPAELTNQLSRIVRPDRTVLVFSGDVSEQDVLAALRPGLTSWYVDQPAPLQGQPPVTQPSPATVKVEAPGPYALVLVGHPGPSRRDPDYYAFNLLNQILGGNPVTSRLAARVRDQERLGPVAGSRLISTTGAIPWAITMRVRPAEVDRAVALAREEIARLRSQAPSQAEIDRAVHALEGQLLVSQASGAGRAEFISNLEFHRLSDSYPSAFAGLYRTITPKDLLETAKRRLQPDNLVIVIAGPGM